MFVLRPLLMPSKKRILADLTPSYLKIVRLAGEDIKQVLTHAPGNGSVIGGFKVTTENGWFAARPSGTEEIYKIYAESFIDEVHLELIIEEAQRIIKVIFELKI